MAGRKREGQQDVDKDPVVQTLRASVKTLEQQIDAMANDL